MTDSRYSVWTIVIRNELVDYFLNWEWLALLVTATLFVIVLAMLPVVGKVGNRFDPECVTDVVVCAV